MLIRLSKSRIELIGPALLCWYACSADAILVSEQCRQDQGPCWESLGLADQRVESLASTPWGLFAGTRNGVFQFDRDQGTWIQRGLQDHWVSSIIFVPRNDGYLLAGVRPVTTETTAAAVFASLDSGQSWLPSDGGLASTNDSRFWAYSLAADPLDPSLILWATSSPILRSPDGGTTWELVKGRLSAFGQGVDDIAFTSDGSGLVWAAGTGVFGVGYVLRSPDRGKTWEQFSPFGESGVPARSIAPDPIVPNRMWLGMGGAIMRFDDLGETWSVALRDAGSVNGIVVVGGTLYAATALRVEIGMDKLRLFRRTPTEAEWVSIPTPESSGALTLIADDGGNLLIGTTDSGVWRFTP